MITSFEVGSIFRIIDEATPGLRKILAQVRELNKAIELARANLADFSKATVPGIAGAIRETNSLSAAWGRVSESAAAAGKAMRSASGAGGGGRQGFASHVLPSGGRGMHFGGPGMAMGGLAADAVYQAAELEKEAYLAWWHSGTGAGTRQQIRDTIQKATAQSGYSYKEVGQATEDIFRLMKGTPNNGLDIAPELLRAGGTEALLKGTTLKESTRSIIELAHMMGIYSPEKIAEMAPVLGFLSTANPASLPQMTRSASYSIPTLSNALGINAGAVLFENTAIARAGATGSKSGTWVEHAFDHALPPDPHTMSADAYSRKMWAYRQANLVDANGKSTIIGADGRIDIEKFLTQTREALNKLPIEMRNAVEKTVFGEQGSRGFELMTSPNVLDQTRRLKAEMPDFVPKYDAFLEQYGANSAVQKARTTYATFNNLLADIGDKVLPSVNRALGEFSHVLQNLRGLIPGGSGAGSDAGKWGVGTTAVQGLAAGAIAGSLLPGVGTVAGGAIGALTGAAYAGIHDAAPAIAETIGAAAAKSFTTHMGGLGGPGAKPIQILPQNMSFNIDGRAVADVVVNHIAQGVTYPTSAAASNGAEVFGP